MAYTPTVWKNGEFPPIDAEHLNKIEQGIANSAPGGFGLGVAGGQSLSATDDLDTVTKNGVYQWSSSLPKNAPIGYCKMRVWNGADWISQEIMSAYANEKDSIRRRVFNNNVWGPFEWVNPPMELGIEYRTTERYLGKPVYAKLVDCGQIADNKQVEHGIVNMRDCTFAQGLRAGMPMPVIYSHNLSDPWSCYIAAVTETKITLACGTSAAGGNCFVILKYTKTTD